MLITLPIKPLSVNKAWQGRRFKTKLYDQYEEDITRLLRVGPCAPECRDEFYVFYVFYIHNYLQSDAGNFEKLLTDILVKRGYFADDRFIKFIASAKEKGEKHKEHIDIFILKNPIEYMELLNKYLKYQVV